MSSGDVDLLVRETLSAVEHLVLHTHGTLSGQETQGPCSIASLRELERRIENSNMFSKNEHVDDLDALSLRCLNVPYYLALAYDGQVTGERCSLLANKRMSLAYYDAFLDRCIEYDAFEPRIKRLVEACTNDEDGEEENRMGGSISREEKIEMFKAERQLKRDVEVLRNSKDENDDDRDRPLALMMVNHCGLKAAGARRMVRQEVAMLDAASAMSQSEQEAHAKMMSEKNEETSILLEKLNDAVRDLHVESKREVLRNGVFKPSHILPTYTVEEFGEMEMVRMKAEQEHISRNRNGKISEDNEIDDVEKSRAWDDFKDDNPKGWGNSRLKPTG